MGLGYHVFFAGYDLLGIIIPLVFILIICIFIVVIVKNISTWNKNNHSPRLTVDAKIVAKRTQITHQNHANAGDITGSHGYSTSSSTRYYITFQFESGDRMEFYVTGSEYGMCAEGDVGTLTFQGTRYLSFERN